MTEKQGIGRFFLVKRTYETIDGRIHTFREKVWDRDGPYEEGPGGKPQRVRKHPNATKVTRTNFPIAGR